MSAPHHRPAAMAIAVATLASSALLAGCSTPPARTLYAWESYPATLYQHLRAPDADTQTQIATLELDLQKMLAANGTPPPGLRAHLGYLYFKVGADDKALANLQAEQEAFPEFGPYMAFLMSQHQNQKKK